ncbi:hypothetical protein JHK86_010625 [Glycine max]|nr:hypothetical protein JHK86_010625 [Glycine max]
MAVFNSLHKTSTRFFVPTGRNSGKWGNVNRFSTAAAVEELIIPQVPITYTKHLINGQFVDADAASGKTFPTYDPRTGEVIARVAEGDAEDINRAVSAARKAFDEGPWPKMTAYKHSDELAALKTWNNGKPYEQWATSELPTFVRLFRYYAVPADGNYHVETLHEPIGVAGQIIPWNFPLLMFAWKVGPALACGNTVILKTAEQTPLTALYVAKAGLPPGVLNVVSGYGPTAGAALASHMDVDKLAFTGSTETGKVVLELAARSNLKPVILNLEGNLLSLCVRMLMLTRLGQCCCAGSRTFVHERIYDEFLEKAKARALKRVVGDPFIKGVEQGPQRVGTVWINCFDVFDAAIPFGGYKMSGISREKGIYSLNNYLQVKAVVSPVKNPAWL